MVRTVYFLDRHGRARSEDRASAEEKGIAAASSWPTGSSRCYHELWTQLGMTHDDFRAHDRDPTPTGGGGDDPRGSRPRRPLSRQARGLVLRLLRDSTTREGARRGRLCPDPRAARPSGSRRRTSSSGCRAIRTAARVVRSEPAPVRPRVRSNEVDRSSSRACETFRSAGPTCLGDPVPGHEGQTVYVWLDALTNYISASGSGSRASEASTTLLGGRRREGAPGRQGHPAVSCGLLAGLLMSAGVPLPTAVWAHGWWLRDERKMSKSVGNVARPDKLIGASAPTACATSCFETWSSDRTLSSRTRAASSASTPIWPTISATR